MRLSKEIVKRIGQHEYYSVERFASDCKAWIAAIKEGRMLCVIQSVSSSGMTRQMEFTSCEKNSKPYYSPYSYRNYSMLFEILGYSVNRSGYVRISGCGMDMVFNTNYCVIHSLCRMGFITKKTCSKLSQMTPTYR